MTVYVKLNFIQNLFQRGRTTVDVLFFSITFLLSIGSSVTTGTSHGRHVVKTYL